MPVLTAPPTLGDLLKFECNPSYCREVVTLKAGTSYPLGAVLGRITASGHYRLAPATLVAGDDGAEIANAVLTEAVDASTGDAIGVVLARGPAILSQLVLTFDTSVDLPAERTAKVSQLAALGLVARATA